MDGILLILCHTYRQNLTTLMKWLLTEYYYYYDMVIDGILLLLKYGYYSVCVVYILYIFKKMRIKDLTFDWKELSVQKI